MLALQEVGNRILNTGEDMTRWMADRFREQISWLDEKIWRLGNAAHAGAGGELEDDLRGREPEVLPESSREPKISHTIVENLSLTAKPLVTPSPYNGKMSWDDYRAQFEQIAELHQSKGRVTSRTCTMQAIQWLLKQAYAEAPLSVLESSRKGLLWRCNCWYRRVISAGKYFKLDQERYRKPWP